MPEPIPIPRRTPIADSPWPFVALVTAAIAIAYFDRQTVSVAITAIQRNIPISNQQFSYLQTAFLLAYAALYIIGGRMLDRLGTRRGFLLIMVWWSLACALHGLATGFTLLLAARFLLGMGEGGAFPAATRVVSEWVPIPQRSTAMGVINAGTAVGSLLARSSSSPPPSASPGSSSGPSPTAAIPQPPPKTQPPPRPHSPSPKSSASPSSAP
jgi:MFS family permease